MAIDGFRDEQHDAFVGYDAKLAKSAAAALSALSRKLHVEYEGLDHLPVGRSLVVMNHAFGWDAAFPMAEIAARLGRRVWVLGEHAWWKFPFLRRVAAAVGIVDGTPANVDRLLQQGEVVFVLPGGLREAVKPRELRYRLLWGHRYGFVKAAMRNGAPIVPLASIGADEYFDFVGDAFRRGAKRLGTPRFPLPRPARWLPIPHLVPLRYVLGEPIVPPVDEHASDDVVARRLRREVEGALHELIETELARRAGVDAG